MVPVAGLAALICLGIGVDFAGQAQAEQDLRDLTAACAREAAAMPPVTASPAWEALDTALACLERYGLTGNAQLADTSVVVESAGTYQTKLLTIIAINTLPVQARSAVTIHQGR